MKITKTELKSMIKEVTKKAITYFIGMSQEDLDKQDQIGTMENLISFIEDQIEEYENDNTSAGDIVKELENKIADWAHDIDNNAM
jgi:hypothetical protein